MVTDRLTLPPNGERLGWAGADDEIMTQAVQVQVVTINDSWLTTIETLPDGSLPDEWLAADADDPRMALVFRLQRPPASPPVYRLEGRRDVTFSP